MYYSFPFFQKKKSYSQEIFSPLKSKCLAIFLCLQCPQMAIGQAHKHTIWIQQAQMPSNEFQANIIALGPPNISYAQYLLKKSREQAKKFQLKDKLITAQELYLSGEKNRALKAFQQISKLALVSDWDEEERRIIIYAFLRQAQMEQKPEQKKALLLSAGEFALFQINSSNYPDFYLFPPPLMEELKTVQNNANFFVLDWYKIFPQHEILLLNGQQFTKAEKIKIPQALYRISAFSSTHQSWSKNRNLSELLTHQIKTKSLTKGFCKKAQIKPEYTKTKVHLLPFPDCKEPQFLSLKKTKQINNSTAQPSEEIQASHSPFSSSPLELEDLEMDMKTTQSEKQTKVSDIAPWLIFGAGAIALILIPTLSTEKEVKQGDYVY